MEKKNELEITYDLTKRYWLFGYYRYYPSGGMSDLTFTADSFQECIDYMNSDELSPPDYIDIFDSHTKKLYDIKEAIDELYHKKENLTN